MSCWYLAAVQTLLMLRLQLLQRRPETLLLLGGDGGVGLVQQGASGLGDLEELSLLGLQLLQLRLADTAQGLAANTTTRTMMIKHRQTEELCLKTTSGNFSRHKMRRGEEQSV